MAAKLKVDELESVDGSTNLILNNSVTMATNKTLPAASLTGTVPTASLGSGTANTTVFLRGDGSWQTAGSTSASDLTSGTLPMARLSGTLPALAATNLTAIPAANITGTLPAISGANLTGLFNPNGAVTINDTGADVDFRVESSNDANAFFVDGANGKIGLGIAGALGATLHIDPDTNVTTSYGSPLVKVGGSNGWAGNGSIYSIGFGYTNGATVKAPVEVGMVTTSATGVTEGSFVVATRDGTTDAAPAKKLEITADGRGLSQFTAKCWINFNGTGTIAIRDSHNVSSITDNGTGDYQVSYTNNMSVANNYCVVSAGRWDSSMAGVYYQYMYTGSFRIATFSGTGVGADVDTVPALVFGD